MSQLDDVVASFRAVRRTPRRRTPRRRHRGAPSKYGFAAAMVALPLAAFTAVFLWDGPPASFALTSVAHLPVPAPRTALGPRTWFETCGDGARINCVVDGDTFWYHGEKIRIADINTPEVSEPGCTREAALGAKATRRLRDLLNAGAFSLERESSGRDTDKYGRKLRTVHRGGESLGLILVEEGLAETWKGYRSSWC